jgi:hypothetical protein
LYLLCIGARARGDDQVHRATQQHRSKPLLSAMETRTRRNHFPSAAFSIADDLLNRNILLLRANTGTRPMLSFDGLRGPRAPPAGPQEDDGKCAPYPSCPQLTGCFPREVDGLSPSLVSNST